MGALHDTLKVGGYSGHDLERFLVRILFCLFAEDTGIFEPESFKLYIENRTHPDGNDLGARLAELFETLDCEPERRQSNLDETLKTFPYVNGELFRERLRFAAFNGPMRKAMIEAANFDWSRISPAIFGALFQEVMEDPDRRKIGAHYTSERDILKVIQPLFLDSLRAEFESIRTDASTRRRAPGGNAASAKRQRRALYQHGAQAPCLAPSPPQALKARPIRALGQRPRFPPPGESTS